MDAKKLTVSDIEKMMTEEGPDTIEILPDGTVKRKPHEAKAIEILTKGQDFPSHY
jgi:hypothetical protein